MSGLIFLILSCYLGENNPSLLFCSRFPTKKTVRLSAVSCAFHLSLLDLFKLIIFGMHYVQEALRLVNFTILLTTPNLWAQIPSLGSCSPKLRVL